MSSLRLDERLITAIILLTILGLLGCQRAEQTESKRNPEQPVARPPYYAVEAPESAPSRGPRDALVTIVTFNDFQASRTAANARSLAEIVQRYSDRVRVVYRANPLPKHGDAQRAELAARAAGRQGRFWEFHDELIKRRKLGEADLLATAEAVGCHRERFLADLADQRLSAEIARDRQSALELAIQKMPMNFVNGRPLEAIRFTDDAAVLVGEELHRAEDLLRSGIEREKLYATIIRGAARQLPGAQRALRRQLDPAAIYRVPQLVDDPVRGPADAVLTVVLFADFECPFSARGHAALTELARELPGEVRVVFKHFPQPSHPIAALAAEAAVEAQAQGRFWETHDALFDNYRELDRAKLIVIGDDIGLVRDALEAALADRRHAPRVERDRLLAAELGLHGTPHFFLNGKLISGSRSSDQLIAMAQPLIREARRVAQEERDGGTLYDKLIDEGAVSPVYLPVGAAKTDPEVVTDGKYRVYAIEVPADAPVLGKSEAPVTVVEFGDYQCGWCRRAFPVMRGLVERFAGQVRVVFFHFPVAGHEHARLAAEAAVEAHRQGKFWEFHEKILESPEALTREDLIAHAIELGLDEAEMRDALEARRHRERVQQDLKTARSLGLTGTPVFFVNGRKASSADFEVELARLVEHVLEQRRRPVSK